MVVQNAPHFDHIFLNNQRLIPLLDTALFGCVLSENRTKMDISKMMSQNIVSRPEPRLPQQAAQEEHGTNHHYPTRRSISSSVPQEPRELAPAFREASYQQMTLDGSILAPKTVSFELLFDGVRNVRGRLPMRVQIYPHDNTESIIASVKSFFGLYDPKGISFEGSDGTTLIASYENFDDNTTVSVRVVSDHSDNPGLPAAWPYKPASPPRTSEVENFVPVLPQPAQILNYGQPPTRPVSRVSRKQSISPKPAQARSVNASKSRARSGIKSQASSFQAGLDELNDTHNGYSSSDGVAGSVSGSRKARSEQLATAEISVDNIVEGGRRKRAKFESSVSTPF